MRNKSSIPAMANLFSRIIIAVYRFFRRQPSSSFDWYQYYGSGEAFGLHYKPRWIQIIKMDMLIDKFIKETGITQYRTKSLYDLGPTDINDCFLVTEHGFLKADDFSFAERISKVFSVDNFSLSRNPNQPDFFTDQLRNPVVLDKARKIATNDKEFTDLKMTFATYLSSIECCKYFTEKIDRYIIGQGIYSYLGRDLYDIDDEKHLKEAINAIITMVDFKGEGVIAHQGTPITEMSKFTLDKLWDKYSNDDLAGFEFDNEARMRYTNATAAAEKLTQVEEEEKLKDQKRQERNAAERARRERRKSIQAANDARAVELATIELEKREKRNAAARERRAKVKAEAMRELNKQKSKSTAKPAKATVTSTRKKATA